MIVTPLGVYFLGIFADKISKKAHGKASKGKHSDKEKQKRNKFKQLFNKIWSKKDILILNTIFTLLLGSIQEIQFFFALQVTNISFANAFNIVSFLISILWLLYEIFIICYVIKVYFYLNQDIKLRVRKSFHFLGKKDHFFLNEKNEQTSGKKNVIPTQLKEKYPFFFGKMTHENYRGTSYLFYRIIKKIYLPLIHVIFHNKVEDVIFYLILFYLCSFLYLRIVQPFRSCLLNIVYEGTELAQINFLFLFKFFVQAVNLQNSEIALTLGVYMIYSIIAIIVMNMASVALTIFILLSGTIFSFFKARKGKARKNSTYLERSKKKETIEIGENFRCPASQGLDDKKASVFGPKVIFQK